jgi:Ca-activated chloride channel family protein
MTFLWPVMFLFLLLVPLFAGLYLRLQARRRRALGSLGLAPGSTGQGPGLRRHVPPALFMAGLTILGIALARPQAVVSLPKIEGTVILAFDVSGSMSANDLTPNRMEAAKAAATAFVENQPGSVQIGVVAFSEGGFSVQAPTDNPETILAAINRLSPQRSTSLGNGILASLNTIEAAAAGDVEPLALQPGDPTPVPTHTPTPVPEGTHAPAIIVLISDGENTAPPDPLVAAQAAADRGVRIYTVGIGSPTGTVLEVEGFTVHTRLDEAMLQQIAEITGGVYSYAANEEQLREIYTNLTPQLVVKPEKMEVTPLFAGAGLLAFLIGGVFSLLWFNRLP